MCENDFDMCSQGLELRLHLDLKSTGLALTRRWGWTFIGKLTFLFIRPISHSLLALFLSRVTFSLQTLSHPFSFSLLFLCNSNDFLLTTLSQSAISLHSKATYQRDWIILTDSSVPHLAPQGCFSPTLLVFRLNTSHRIISIISSLPVAGN